MNIGKPQLERWFTPWGLAQIQDQIGPLGIRMEIEPRHYLRSLDQNKLYWALVKALADYSGDTKNGLHEEILAEAHGYDVYMLPNGKVRKVPRGRSHNLNVTEFSELIGIAERWCAEMGVPVEASRR